MCWSGKEKETSEEPSGWRTESLTATSTLVVGLRGRNHPRKIPNMSQGHRCFQAATVNRVLSCEEEGQVIPLKKQQLYSL